MIPQLPPISGVATSQTSQAVNGQVQNGEVVSTQTLDVDAVSDQTTAETSATGNAYSAAVETGDLDVQSTQSMQGNATGTTILNVVTYAGDQVSLSTEGTGNTSEADNVGGGALTGTFQQTTGAVSITTESQVNADAAQAGDLTVTNNAIANTQGLGVVGGTANTTVTQTSQALTQSNGGGVLEGTLGTATFSALAVSNNVTATGTDGSAQTLNVNQTMTGERTQAAQFLAFGEAQTLTNAATATANNVSVTNDGPSLDVTTVQDNESYLRTQAETTAFQFGTSSTMATGVGNSVMAGETSGPINIDNTQTNSGDGVQVVASSAGFDGFDLSASATAMGNAVTGFSCSLCGGSMTARNSQTNSADVSAVSTLNLGVPGGGSARSVTGTSTAVGNSATFYVSRPTGG